MALSRAAVSAADGRFMILQEEFSDPAIRKSADRRRVSQARDLELKRFAEASVRKSFASLHRRHEPASRPDSLVMRSLI